MEFEEEVRKGYNELTKRLIEKNRTITTMESCTSGQVASLITDTEGASAILKGAYVTYSNEGKIKCGVPKETIDTYGVYSRETAIEMARACKASYQSDYSVGVTGSMGNVDPANADSVPGKVYFAIGTPDGEILDFYRELPPQDTRIRYKMLVAKEILAELMKLI